MKIIEQLRAKLKAWKRERKINTICEQRGSCCMCSQCNEPLDETSTGEDCSNGTKDGFYRFTCGYCKSISYFHYSIAPVPILIEGNTLTTMLKHYKVTS